MREILMKGERERKERIFLFDLVEGEGKGESPSVFAY